MFATVRFRLPAPALVNAPLLRLRAATDESVATSKDTSFALDVNVSEKFSPAEPE